MCTLSVMREKEGRNQTITGNNLTAVNYHALIQIEEDMTAHLGKRCVMPRFFIYIFTEISAKFLQYSQYQVIDSIITQP